MVSNHDFALENTPPELHLAIRDYLNTSSLLSLSRTSSKLRYIYNKILYERVIVYPRYIPPLSDKSNVAMDCSKCDYNSMGERKKLVPVRIPYFVFMYPEDYSWFPNTSVKYVFMEYDFPFSGLWYPGKDLMSVYPQLKYLDYPNNENGRPAAGLLLIHPPFESRIIVQNLESTQFIRFYNLVHYVRSLKEKEPARMIYITVVADTGDMDDTDIKDEHVTYISGTELEDLEAAPGYWNEESIMQEQILNHYIEVPEKSQYDPSFDPPSTYFPYSYEEINIFPKPNWTDNITRLYVDLYQLRVDFRDDSAITMYRYFKLDNYPSLRKVEINDKETPYTVISEIVYESLEKCTNLREVIIFYQSGCLTSEEPCGILNIINAIKGNFNLFLSASFDFYLTTQYREQIAIRNPLMKIMDITTKQEEPNILLELNPEVLQELSCDIFSSDDPTLKSIISYKDCLVTLTIRMHNKHDEIKQISSAFQKNCFPKLKSLYLDLNKCETNFSAKKIEPYFRQFIKLVKFGEPPKKIGQAVEVFKKLQSRMKQKASTQKFSDIVKIAKNNKLYEKFFKCYDNPKTHKKQCCQASIEPELLTGLYCFFAICFCSQHTPTDATLSTFLIEISQIDLMAAAIHKSMPSLEFLELTQRNCPLSENGMSYVCQPHLQSLLKHHANLQHVQFGLGSTQRMPFNKPQTFWEGGSSTGYSFYLPEKLVKEDEWLSKVLFRGLDKNHEELFMMKEDKKKYISS